MHKHTRVLLLITVVITIAILQVIDICKQKKVDNPKHIDLPEEWRGINDNTPLKGRVSGDTLYIEFKN